MMVQVMVSLGGNYPYDPVASLETIHSFIKNTIQLHHDSKKGEN